MTCANAGILPPQPEGLTQAPAAHVRRGNRKKELSLACGAVTVRVPTPLADQCRQLAHGLGWRLAPLLRILICIGACILFLTAGKAAAEKAASKLLGGLELARFTRAFTVRQEASSRHYVFRMRGRKSELFTLTLPQSFRDLVSIYADYAHATCNQTYYRFLQQGLITYLKAQASLLEANAKRQAASGEGLKAEPNHTTNGAENPNPHAVPHMGMSEVPRRLCPA
jgi:hypothetical protein